MRINKFISETGYCSRREADRLVEAGRVTINGVIAQPGSQAELADEVRIDHQRIGEQSKHVYIALHKPRGITCTTERTVRGNIVDYVNHAERIFPIGRLDKDSEGLILMTNDGDIVNKILRAEERHDKEYIVTVDKYITPRFIQAMSEGIHILGSMTLPCNVERLSNTVFRIILNEGRNRQIRRMCTALGYRVLQLQRVRIMNIKLDDTLPYGKWRPLTEQELNDLFRQLRISNE